MAVLKLFGSSVSGNCLKPRWVAERLGVPFDWMELDIMRGDTRQPEFLLLNPWGQAPLAVLADGRMLAQSNAIMLHLAEGSDLVPNDAFDRAKMYEWLFWEQYSHEPTIAVRRWRRAFLKHKDDEIDPTILTKGQAALSRMDNALEGRLHFAGDRLSLADIALVAYTRWAPQGGFDLEAVPRVVAWIDRVEKELGLPSARAGA